MFVNSTKIKSPFFVLVAGLGIRVMRMNQTDRVLTLREVGVVNESVGS